MSFFETASLVLISDFAAASASAVSGSGTNTGKAYSVKPTDGSGDFAFERGSDITATRVNKDGYIEKGRGNFLLQSNQFDTTWSLLNSQVTSGQSGYDGSNDAWLLGRSGGGVAVFIRSTTIAASGICTISIYAKADNSNWLVIQDNGASNILCYFDLSNGTIGFGSPSIIDKQITSFGNGWYRCSITTNRSSGLVQFYVATANQNLAGPSDAALYIQDAQLEQGLVATDYIETTTAPLRAGLLEDEPRFDYHNSASATPSPSASLLLEPSRENKITNSEYIDASTDWNTTSITIEDNSITSPENQTNAAKLTGNSGDSQKRIYQSFSQVSGEDFTISIFAKEDTENILFLRLYNTTDAVYANASFNLSTGVIASNASGTAKIENYGNGWYRCILTGTPSTTTTTGGAYFNLTSDGNTTSTTSLYLWGAQIEQGSYATSYIPTYGTAATRGVDNLIGSTAFNGGNAFSIYLEMGPIEGSEQILLMQTSPLDFYFRWTSSSTLNIWNQDNNSTLRNITGQNRNQNNKILMVYDGSGGNLVFLNGTKYTANNYTWPSEDYSLRVGSQVGVFGSPAANSKTFKSILVFPEALSDTDCEILTGATTYSSFAAMASALNYTVYE